MFSVQLVIACIEDVVPIAKTVKPTKVVKERILVESPPTTFVWAFRTEKMDIAFGVLFNKQVRDYVIRD